MIKKFTPEDILSDGEDHTNAVNPFTGFQGRARKGTVAATLSNIALLDRLFLEEGNENQIHDIKNAVIELLPSLRAVGMFSLFDPLEWVNNEKHWGRIYIGLLYLRQFSEEINDEIVCQLLEIEQKFPNPFFQSELEILLSKREFKDKEMTKSHNLNETKPISPKL